MPRFCGNCGKPAGDSEKFCAGCGAALPEVAQVPSPVETAAENIPQQPSQPAATQTQPAAGFNSFGQNNQAFNDPGAAAPQAGAVPGASPASAAAGAIKKLNPVPLIIGAAAIILVIVAIVIVSRLTRFEKIDAKDLVDVDFYGPDGYGECYAQLDVDPYFASAEYDIEYEDFSITKGGEEYDKIKYSPYFAEKKSKLEDAYKKAKSGSDAKDMRDALLKTNKKTDTFSITVKPSKSSGLKNGDKVTVEVKYDEEDLKEANIKLTNTKFDVEVKGLAEAETIDAFEGFAPKFTGLDGNGELDYSTTSSKYDFVTYYLEDGSSYNLSNGDELKFSASLYVYDTHPLDEKDSSKGVWFTYEGKVYVWPYNGTSATQSFKVDGLTPLEEIDPTDEIVLEYESASPFLNVSAKLKDGSKIADDVYLNVEGGYDHKYKIGDKVKVLVSTYSSLANNGYKLKGSPNADGYYEYEIPVADNAPRYVDNGIAKEVDEGIAKEVKNQETTLKQDLQGSSYYKGLSIDSKVKKITKLEKLDSYISVNDITEYESLGWSSYVNYYSNIYKVDCKLEKGNATIYVVMSFKDVIKNEDGTFSMNDYADLSAYEKKEDAVEAVKGVEGYTVTNVKDCEADTAPSSAAPEEPAETADSAAETQPAESEAPAETSAPEADSAAETSAETEKEEAKDESKADEKADAKDDSKAA